MTNKELLTTIADLLFVIACILIWKPLGILVLIVSIVKLGPSKTKSEANK